MPRKLYYRKGSYPSWLEEDEYLRLLEVGFSGETFRVLQEKEEKLYGSIAWGGLCSRRGGGWGQMKK